jgi:hypothetical protein
MDWQEIVKWAAGIVAAIAGAGLVFRFAFVRKSQNSKRTITQNNNRAGRDIIGGDKIDNR